jgi:Flp pilus assembly protein TadG
MSRVRSVPARSPSARIHLPATRARQAGQALAEMAIVVSVMLVMALALFDIGRGVHAYIAVIQGARDGARVAMESGATDAEVTSAAKSAAAPLDPAVNVERSAGSVRVTVSYQYEPISPFAGLLLGGPTLDLSSTMVSQ